MKKIASYSSIIIAFVLFSCSKHRGDIPEHIPSATIVFQSPVAGSSYSNADSLFVSATAISTETIHGYDLAIRKTNDTTSYFFQHVHDHNDTLNINTKWKSTLSGINDMEVIVTLVLDHDGHTLTKKLPFKLQ